MVRIQLGSLRLVDDRAGRYAVQEIACHQSGKSKGEEYVARRYSGLTLPQALTKMVDLFPHQDHQEIRTLAGLHAALAEAQTRIELALSNARPERCDKCGAFKRWHTECRRCSYLATKGGRT